MPPKRKRPRRRAPTPPSENDEYKQKIKDIVNTLEECHDDKIKSLGTLIMYIFNTTDESHGISEEVTDAIQKLHPISVNNKELSKPNLKETNDLIKTLQQTVGNKNTPDGLIDSYQQVVKAIVKYAENIKCPEEKSFDPKPFEDIIVSLERLDEEYKLHQKIYDKKRTCDELGLRSNSNQKRNTWNNADNEGKIKRCKISLRDIQKTADFKKFKGVYDKHIDSKKHHILIANIEQLKKYLSDLHTPYNNIFSTTGGLIHQLEKMKRGGGIVRLSVSSKKSKTKTGGSKHHKTKTTKKRIKGKQTRRNKAKNKTTIKAKNTTTIKAKNKTTIKAKNKTKKR